MKIKTVKIQAFKSYLYREDGTFDFMCLGQDQTLEVANFVSIYAPNGFGKTSFYDAVDYCITKNITRYIRAPRLNTMNKKEVTNHNQANQKQYILRNRIADDVDINLNTCVDITTTKQTYQTDYKKPNNRSADYRFNPNDTPSDRRYFRDVILTQEAIDAFLREDTAADRYSKFIVNQINGLAEVDEQRIIIGRLLSDIKVKCDKLDEDKLPIQAQIDAIEVNENIFADANELIDKLNQQGTRFTLLNGHFDENHKHQLDNKITLAKPDIVKTIEEQQLISQSTNHFYDSLDIFQHWYTESSRLNFDVKNSENVLKNKKQLVSYKLELDTYLHKSGLSQNELLLINDYAEKLPAFVRYQQKIARYNKLLKEHKASIRALRTDEQAITTNLTAERQNLQLQLSSKQTLLDKQVATPGYYRNIAEIQKRVLSHTQKINIETESQDKSEQEIVLISRQIAQIKLFDITQLISVWPEWPTTKELNELHLQFEEAQGSILQLQTDEQTKQAALKTVQLQSTAIAELIRQSSDIIAQTQQSNCPLCDHPYPDVAALQKEISNNPALNMAEKNLLDVLSGLQSQRVTVEEKLAEFRMNYNTVLIDNMKIMSENITNKQQLINQSKGVQSSIEAETVSDERSLAVLFDVTLSKTQAELIAYLDEQTKQCDSRVTQLKASIANIELRKAQAEKDVAIQVSSSNMFDEDRDRLMENREFEGLQAYLAAQLISPHVDEEYTDVTILKDQVDIIKNVHHLRLVDFKMLIEELTGKIDNITGIITAENHHCEIPVLQKDLDDKAQALSDLKNKMIPYQQVIDGIDVTDFMLKNDWQGVRGKLNEILEQQTLAIAANTQLLVDMGLLSALAQRALDFGDKIKFIGQLTEIENISKKLEAIKTPLSIDLKQITHHLEQSVTQYFYPELINQIYQSIDPHPDFKDIKFNCKIPNNGDKPELYIELSNPKDDSVISPTLHFSSAQINVLSLSIFLAKALTIKDDNCESVDCIFIDDPIQSMDSINVLGLIDLFRNLSFRFDKQLIISTHDENFHELLKKKMPPDIFQAKYLKLTSFGKVEVDQ